MSALECHLLFRICQTMEDFVVGAAVIANASEGTYADAANAIDVGTAPPQ